MKSEIARRFDLYQWRLAAVAASIAWLVLLCVAAVLLLAPKLQSPAFGAGADLVETFTGVVLVGLGILGVPIEIGNLTISVIPLGALVLFGLGVVWAAGSVIDLERSSVGAWVMEAIRVGAVFAVLAVVFAIIFRFGGRDPVAARIFSSLIKGFVWTTLFAFVGLAKAGRSWRTFIRDLRRPASESPQLYRAALSVGSMLIVAFVLALGFGLVAVIIALSRGLPYPEYGLGDALSSLLYVLAFLPNVLIAIVTLSLGAPVFRGVQVGFGGEVIGGIERVVLFQDKSLPGAAYLLLIIPVLACIVGGFVARRWPEGASDFRTTILGAALLFAVTLGVLAVLSDARLGAGLLSRRGVALLAPSALWTSVLAFFWAAAFGAVGWIASERFFKRST